MILTAPVETIENTACAGPNKKCPSPDYLARRINIALTLAVKKNVDKNYSTKCRNFRF